MSVNSKWGSTFEMICVSIIYRVRIVSITNISGRFMVSDTLSLLNVYQIVNNNNGMSYRYIYLYCPFYKALTTPCAQDIILNHFSHLDVVEELPIDSNRQIYYGDSRDSAYSVKNEYHLSGSSYSGDTFSLILPPVSAPSPLDNQCCHIISSYSMIINSSQNSNEFDSSNVKYMPGQK